MRVSRRGVTGLVTPSPKITRIILPMFRISQIAAFVISCIHVTPSQAISVPGHAVSLGVSGVIEPGIVDASAVAFHQLGPSIQGVRVTERFDRVNQRHRRNGDDE